MSGVESTVESDVEFEDESDNESEVESRFIWDKYFGTIPIHSYLYAFSCKLYVS